jgi:hypothetical protein
MQKLTSSTLVNTYLGTTDVNYDNYIKNISSLILGYTGRAGFKQKSYTLISSDKNKIFLKALPLLSIDEVKDLDTNTLIDDYKANWASGIITVGYAGNFQVKYTGGYLIDFTAIEELTGDLIDYEAIENLHTLPYELSTVATQLTAALVEKSQSAEAGGVTSNNNVVASESVEGQSVSYFNKTGSGATENILGGVQLSDYQMQILSNYSLNDFV